MVKFIIIIFLAIIGFIFYCSTDFEQCSCSCEDNTNHEPVCQDSDCLYCATGFIGIDVKVQDFSYHLDNPDPYLPIENIYHIADLVTDLDKPPRA